MDVEPVVHKWKTSLIWTSEKRGILGCEGKPDIHVACPPEFGGHPGIWSPEDLFVGSVELCTMTTFLWLAGRQKLKIISYNSEAEGKASLTEGAMRYTEILVKPIVEVADAGDRDKCIRIFGLINKYCLISNSVTPEVKIEAMVGVAD